MRSTSLTNIFKYDPLITIYYFTIATISFDIFLVIPLGFNFRASQIALLIIMCVMMANGHFFRPLKVPLGFRTILIWSFFIIAFIPTCDYVQRCFGYALWLIFNLLLLLITVQLFDGEAKLIRMVKFYIISFFLIALFGLFQFVAPRLHLNAPLVTQWWFPGVLPRVNGFSYEPSYFSTYMLIGWVLTASLLKAKSELFDRKYLFLIFAVISIVMILSTSRMGWIMMIAWYLQYPILFVMNLLKGEINKKLLKYCLILICLVLGLFVYIDKVIGWSTIIFLFSGLGIAGSADHSAGSRIRELSDTFRIFLNNPFIGYSLGGISPAIGKLRGINVNSLELAKQNEGMCVFVEVLAASGIVGAVPFAVYIIKIINSPMKLAKKIENKNMRDLLVGMTLSLIFLLIILQFNQNILRPYLWLHIAILSVTYSVALQQYKEPNKIRHMQRIC